MARMVRSACTPRVAGGLTNSVGSSVVTSASPSPPLSQALALCRGGHPPTSPPCPPSPPSASTSDLQTPSSEYAELLGILLCTSVLVLVASA
jgi:hypothetical protein